jgi:hypothetical protein
MITYLYQQSERRASKPLGSKLRRSEKTLRIIIPSNEAGHSLGVPLCARNVFGQFRTLEL